VLWGASMSYIFQRGETVSLALAVVSGDPGIVTGVTAAIKPVTPGRGTPDPGVPVAANFSVSFVGAQGNESARWLLTLSPATSAALSAGSYLADARLAMTGGVSITETVALSVRDAVTS
jgi:hypothetical protein